MVFVKDVQGNTESAVPLSVQETTVYVRKNIKEIGENLYQWDEIQYTKNEYIEMLQKQVETLDIENKEAIAEIYEMII